MVYLVSETEICPNPREGKLDTEPLYILTTVEILKIDFKIN